MTTLAAPPAETKEIAVYPDGSGNAKKILARNLERLTEESERILLLRDFIRKYQHTLAGLSWEPSIHYREVSIDCHLYCGELTSAKAVAALFPGLKWEIAEPAYGIDKETVRDWTSELDGVVVRIRKAQCAKPVVVSGLPRLGSKAFSS